MAEKVVAVTLTARTAPYIAQMAAAAQATNNVGTAAARANVASQPMGRSLRNAARATDILNPKLIGAAGLVFGLKSVVGQAKDFEDQFANVRKTMNESDEVLDQVALNLRELATGMPVTTTELNEIATVAGQLGIKAEDVTHFTDTIAKLSVTTNLTAEGAAIDFARLSNILGKPIDQVDELGNVAVRLGNNMAAQETEIIEFAKRIAGVGTQMGMTEEEILALSAALPALGLRAEMGGTAITRIMVQVQEAVTEAGDKLGLFAQTAGMSSEEFAAAWRDDAANTLLEFTAGIGNMSDEGADAFSTIADLDLSMIRTQDTALRLAGGTEQYANALALARDEMQKGTANQIEWDKRLETTASQFGILKNNIREFALEIGGPLNESLGDMLELLNQIWDGRPDEGIAGAIAGAMPGGTLFGQDPLTGEDRNLMQAVMDAFGGAVDPGGDTRDFFSAMLSARAEEGRQGLADNNARHLDAMAAQAERYVNGLTGVDPGAESHLAAMASQADQYVGGLIAAGEATRDLEGATDDLEGPLGDLRREMDDNATSALELAENIKAIAGVNLDAASAAIATRQGFRDLSETLKETEGTLDSTTEAGDRNREAIIGQVESIFDEMDARRRQGASLGAVMALYDDQMVQLREVATEAGVSEEAFDELIEMMGLTPEEVRTAILVDDFASQTIEDYIARLGRVPRRIVTQLRTEKNLGGSLSGDQSGLHTGGYIHPDGSIQRFHGGGMVGNRLRQDEVPAILQTGEMVLSRADVSQIRAAVTSGRSSLTVQQTFNGDVSRNTLAEARHQQRLAFLEAV